MISEMSRGEHRVPKPRVYIVILNWNGWRDTIECLESVFRLNYPNYRIIVCDNASTNDSVEKIRSWARGQEDVEVKNPLLSSFVLPQSAKPIPLAELHAEERDWTSHDQGSQLTILHTGANRGFAAGNNVALNFVLKCGEFDYVWLLNNDTIVEPDALTELIQRANRDKNIGICGSTLLYYDDPHIVQACGGATYNPWLARATHIGDGLRRNQLPPLEEVERDMAYVAGASMLVSRQFLEAVGLMSEGYFLYFEEIDWARRAGADFRLAYCPASFVYHKEGASVGASRKRDVRSVLANYFSTRNRMVITRMYFRFAIITAVFVVTAGILRNLLRGDGVYAHAALRGLWEGLRMKLEGSRRFSAEACRVPAHHASMDHTINLNSKM